MLVTIMLNSALFDGGNHQRPGCTIARHRTKDEITPLLDPPERSATPDSVVS